MAKTYASRLLTQWATSSLGNGSGFGFGWGSKTIIQGIRRREAENDEIDQRMEELVATRWAPPDVTAFDQERGL